MTFSGKKIARRQGVSTPESEPTNSGYWNCSTLLQRIYQNRNIADGSELDYSLSKLLPPDSLKNGSLATRLLCEAIATDQRILILGDYDTDGATATALAIRVLKEFGCTQVDYLVPNRFDYGYGLSVEIATVALTSKPDLVITVDNGISSLEGVERLKQGGVRVIITDHHLPSDTLPEADAILNPNQFGCEFPSKNLAGVGVMFYLLMMARSQLRIQGWFEMKGIVSPNLGKYLDLVALGTFADVVPLDYNNRLLVSQGVSRIRAGRCAPGILAILESAGRDFNNMIASDLGFVVAPRLNASGRLKDISTGIECLLADTGTKARRYAASLEEINSQRKEIEQEMQTQALEIVRNVAVSKTASDSQCYGICLFEESWHQGITGLVASRIREKTSEPVVAFARTQDGLLTGSARSIKGLHIRDLLDLIATTHHGLIIKFGGHAMAAGLTIQIDDLEQFKLAFQHSVTEHFSIHGSSDVLMTDGELGSGDITLGNAEEIRHAAPWGQGFPVPLFEGTFKVTQSKVVGKIHLKMELALPDNSKSFDAIAFRALEPGQAPPDLDLIDAVYQLDVNEFQGRRRLQLLIEHFIGRE